MRWFLLLLATVAQAQVVDVSILHFNDFHAKFLPVQGRGGVAHLVTAINRERANCPRCLLLSAGDNVQGSPVSTIYRGLPVFDVLRALKTDAMVLGNHEFDYGAERINDFLAAVGQPLLAANFVTPEGRLFTETGSVIIERDGLRIGVVGVLMDDIVPKLTTPAKLGENRMLPPLETLRKEAARLRGQTDMLIALVHLWKEQCDQIVQEIPDYAVVVSGHDHAGMAQAFRVEDRVGVRLRSNGTEFGRLDLKYDKATRKLVESKWKIIPVTTAEYPADVETAKLVEKWESKVRAVVDVKIGTNPVAQKQEWIQKWIERVMIDKSGADVSHMNRGGVRDTLPAGIIEARHIWNISPFDNLMVTGTVPGRLIPEFMKPAAEIDPNKQYKVTTIDFLIETWRSGNDEKLKEFARAMPLDGPTLRDVLIDWVKAKKIIE